MMTLRSQWIDDDDNWGLSTATKGGDGSGFFGHAGRPGERGGSAPSGSAPQRDNDLGTADEYRLDKPNPRSPGKYKPKDIQPNGRVKDMWGKWHRVNSIDNGDVITQEGRRLNMANIAKIATMTVPGGSESTHAREKPKDTPRSSILKYSDLEKARRVRDRADDAMGIIQGDDDQFWVVPMGEFEKLINQGYEAVPAHGR